MRNFLFGLAAIAPMTVPCAAQERTSLATPNAIVAAAPASDWKRIASDDLLVMDLTPGPESEPRRVVIQLVPAPFSQGWVNNIRTLAAAHWYDGIAVVRSQDNYVVQWGDPNSEDEVADTLGRAKPLPAGLNVVPESEYLTPLQAWSGDSRPSGAGMLGKDAYAPYNGFIDGWPIAGDDDGRWPVHCYGMVGVGRNISPDTGTGAELYVVTGHAPRQLDRNIALVGRVISGIEHLSSLPRGKGDLGFYQTAKERTLILSVRRGDEVAGLPAYEYLGTGSTSFAAYVKKRANRKDDFYIRPAGGVDVCNVPVPIRMVGT